MIINQVSQGGGEGVGEGLENSKKCKLPRMTKEIIRDSESMNND